MAAKKKSASSRPSAKAKSKKATPKAKSRKPTPKTKRAAVRKRQPAGKTAAASRRKTAPAPKRAVRKAAPPKVLPSPALAEIEQRIAIGQNNLRDLAEQAAGASGNAREELLSDRISKYEADLQGLRRERDKLAKGRGR